MPDRVRETTVGMHLRRESARRHELVDVAACPPKRSGVAPELGRLPRTQGTPQALRFFASALVELPQDVCWADQPVLVGHVQLDGPGAGRRHAESVWAQERGVVEV